MNNQTYELYVRVLTPVHIGGEQEKNLREGVDYIINNYKVHRFDERKLINKLGIDNYINAIGSKDIKEALKITRISVNTVSDIIGEVDGSCGEIRMMVREGMYGRPYLPGSSLKGALRSVLFKSFGGDKGKTDLAIFGEFENSVMRFVQVSDVYFDGPGELINTKIMSPRLMDGAWVEGWKHARKGSKEFDNRSFTTGLQVLPIGALAKLNISINKQALEEYATNGTSKLPYKGKAFLTATDVKDRLFAEMKKYTDCYLEREIDYFLKIDGFRKDGEIVTPYQNLLEENKAETPIVRVGFGSGYHSVTGDYYYNDHIESLRKEQYPKQKKTRRIAFTYDEKEDRINFYPLGFIQLMSDEAAESYLAKQQQAKLSPTAEQISAMVPPPVPSSSEAKLNPKIPESVEVPLKKLRNGFTVTCTAIRNEGNQVVVKPLVSGYENSEVYFRFSAGMNPGQVCEGMVKLEGNKLIGVKAPRIL